jgi:hypothetical protein
MTHSTALSILKWAVALACAIGGVLLLLNLSHGHAPRLPIAILEILAITEIVAAVLFLIPPTMRFGGWFLFAILLAAIFVHLVHGQYEVENLAVYAAAVLAVLSRG